MPTLPPAPSPWWGAERHRARRPFLAARGRIKAALRGWFEARGFTEVECPALQVSPGNEAHLHAFATDLVGPDLTVARRYLHTSPEFTAKKLLAAGETAIFDFARVFRNREGGPLHSPEFTLLEWYRAGAPYETLMDDCAALLALATEAAGTTTLSWRGRTADPFAEPERLTVADAFARFAGIDLLATLSDDPTAAPDRDGLAAQAATRGYRVVVDDSWTDIYSRVLVQDVEPRLGFGRATVLCEYPVCEAALSRPVARDPRVAERFELYACGVELANAFGELTDPVEQRRRFEEEMAIKEAVYGDRYPIDEDFLAALGQMPAASGIAMGFERLVIVAMGARGIDDVVWAPVR
ncbi:EF-P lysine aminoacylase EpmA [Oharaeibacter diazotrophicus]|uniref:Lysyl-tRNA synthetase class 2 n=1 Tax=Oharaeibacter diazotrophicus TaxID=1920512 RepID=A0A4R6RGN7_9HYPH|nr:EF-P lysine aminoacylase EpmA [Oharaeibacter diazotrophicus]TDP85523.1 lysyl-tRNA synthetase class 2 [Oharaeibacter diazotrophicus]BBE74494.1 elongation factor P-(R)-beta-lysine ligase [Pleomorphomonas sp. SM30]GLS75808.1 elongation factor P--(R)-beta-lysine ligase [Oharaeibacter diazotrophicus]